MSRKIKRIVVKIGTSTLTGGKGAIDREVVRAVTEQVCALMDDLVDVIVVSSGAIGAGLGLLKVARKGRSLSELAAIAGVGQSHLMDVYNEYLSKKGYVAGQMLLTQEDFNDRKRFLNIKHTLDTLLKYRAVPVINENDSVSTEEIKCGDNDRLSSLVADLAGADMLILLTDVEGLYDKNGELIRDVDKITEGIRSLGGSAASDVSTGGMATKIEAARNATLSGIECVIADGRRRNVILDAVAGKAVGTFFSAAEKRVNARRRWMAFSIRTKGRLTVDDGAKKAVVHGKKSLLPGGIIGVRGNFASGDVVDISDRSDRIIARGLVNYSSREILKIKGLRTDMIEKTLGYKDYDEVVHRDNLVVMEAA